jgi:hypothetical protein
MRVPKELTMAHVYSRLIEIFVLLLLTGCANGRKEQDTKEDVKDLTLTAEIAKKSFLEMDLKQIPAGVLVPAPRDEPIKVLNADEIAVGNWNCNLKEKTFHGSAFYRDAPRHRINEVAGVFQQDRGENWVAKVTHSSSGN